LDEEGIVGVERPTWSAEESFVVGGGNGASDAVWTVSHFKGVTAVFRVWVRR
jgi:hypothetical protein